MLAQCDSLLLGCSCYVCKKYEQLNMERITFNYHLVLQGKKNKGENNKPPVTNITLLNSLQMMTLEPKNDTRPHEHDEEEVTREQLMSKRFKTTKRKYLVCEDVVKLHDHYLWSPDRQQTITFGV